MKRVASHLPGSGDPTSRRPDIYRRVAQHERSLWLITIAVVVMCAATLALVTVASAMAGAFHGPYIGFVLGGGSFLLLALFIVYVGAQRETLEQNRARIFRELESRSAELAQSNRALEDALRTRDVFLSTVSHELKTPLTCILAYAEFLTEGEQDPAEAASHAAGIVSEGRGLVRLIDQMVDVTRFRTGSMTLRREMVDVSALVKTVAASVRSEADRLQVELTTRLGGERLHAHIDPARMSDAVECLLRDALKHSQPLSRILVRVRSVDEDWVEIAVEDRSARRADKESAILFSPFARIDPEPNGRAGDLGLGLPLVKRFVMAHGGLLHVGEAEPQGLSFRIQLPREILEGDLQSRPPGVPDSGLAEIESLDAAS